MHLQGFTPRERSGLMGHHHSMTVWIDTHCHLDAPEFDPDRDAVRAQARTQGVAHCVIPAVERSNWATVRGLAHRHGDSYALGIHPLYTGRAHDADLELLAQELEQHRADQRLVAIGEIGLDYFPVAADDAARLIIAVDQHDGADAALTISGAVFRACWEQQRNMADAPTLAALLAECGLQAHGLSSRAVPMRRPAMKPTPARPLTRACSVRQAM